jgi:hypothetical protein
MFFQRHKHRDADGQTPGQCHGIGKVVLNERAAGLDEDGAQVFMVEERQHD